MDCDGPVEFKEQFAAGETHRLSALGIVVPEFVYAFLLTQDHVSVGRLLGDLSKGLESPVGGGLHQRGVTDEGNAFNMSLTIAAAVEATAVEGADQAIVANEASQNYCRGRSARNERNSAWSSMPNRSTGMLPA